MSIVAADHAATRSKEELDTGHRRAVRRGLGAAVALAVISVIEYFVAQEVHDPTWYMVPFMVVKGGIILEIFMHVGDLWKKEAH